MSDDRMSRRRREWVRKQRDGSLYVDRVTGARPPLVPVIGTDGGGRPLAERRADVVFRCSRCRALLWHARADFDVIIDSGDPYQEGDGFQPFLIDPDGAADWDADGKPFLGLNSHLHVALIPMIGWGDDKGSEVQNCPNAGCARRATISRRRTYLRLRNAWDQARAAGESRRAYVDV